MGTTYYVSAANGNNNNPGTDPAQPLRTIQAAVNKLQAGDTVAIRTGVYAERLLIQKPGTTDAPILIKAYESEQPVLDGASLNIPEEAALVVIQQSQDITLAGLAIRNARGRGLLVSKSSRINIRNCSVETAHAGGIHAVQCETVLVEKCRVRDCGRQFLVYGPERKNVALLSVNSRDVTVQENEIFENSDQGILIAVGCEKVTVRKNLCYDNRNGQIGVSSSIDILVDSNLCYHTGRDSYLDLRGKRGPGITKTDLARYREGGAWHSRNLRISNNIIVGCGVGFQTEREGGSLDSFMLAHNTILNSTEEAIKIGTQNSSRRSYIENNLIATTNGGEMTRVISAPGVVWRHNLWSSFPGDKVFNPANDVVESEPGVVNLAASVEAGKVSADPYMLAANSPAIDRGIYHVNGQMADYWGKPRDGRPDLGAGEFPGGAGDPPEDDSTLPPDGVRVTEGLLALYDFKEGQGRQVRDVSGVGDAMNLRIKDANRVTWGGHGLDVRESTVISSESPARKVISACRQSAEITVEVWIRPASLNQDGPARILSISSSKTERNMTLGQGLHGDRPTDLYIARLRTTQTSTNGLPAVITPAGIVSTDLTHIVYTRRADGQAVLYVNGQDRGILPIGGDLSTWDERMPLLLGNELSEDRPWLGVFRLAAIYSRALTPAEVLHNYEANNLDDPIIAEFTVSAGAGYGVAPHAVMFDASESVAEAGIASHFWEFGDGQTSNQPNPTYTYTTAGVYTVSLTITDSQGRTDKITRERLITVVDSPIPPLPATYARFILINVSDSSVIAFGIQFPDYRCGLMWNSDPYHMLVYNQVEDVQLAQVNDGLVEIVWVDPLEEA